MFRVAQTAKSMRLILVQKQFWSGISDDTIGG